MSRRRSPFASSDPSRPADEAKRGRGARLEVSGITVKFAGLVALSEVSLTAEPGTVHAVIGPNGAGKSTLFNVFSSLYRPTAGSVTVDGDEIVGRSPHEVARLGVGRAFQKSSLFEGLTVEENLLLGRHRLTRAGVLAGALRVPSARREEVAGRQRVREVAEFMGIANLLDSPGGDLPYGAAKRVDVARALCTEPTVLLLDEPAAGLHTHEKLSMGRTIRRIALELGTTVLLVEHDMAVVMSISDQITVLDFGTVIATGTPDQIQADPKVIQAYLGDSTSDQEDEILMSTSFEEARAEGEQTSSPGPSSRRGARGGGGQP